MDQHCARARAAGAVIVREPADQFYGDRVYSARDAEGHVWSFGQTVRQVSREDAPIFLRRHGERWQALLGSFRAATKEAADPFG